MSNTSQTFAEGASIKMPPLFAWEENDSSTSSESDDITEEENNISDG